MKKQEFIELLNLYLDHEIAEADAARLEAEVRGNVGRRALYNQYCRMHKACTALGTDFVAAETASFDATTVARESARRRRRAAYYGFATFAAAACVALVFVGRTGPKASENGVPGRGEIAAVVFNPPAVAARAGGIVQRPMLMADPLFLSRFNRPDAELTAVTQQQPDQLAWIQGVRLAPLQLGVAAAELRFQAAPISLRPEARILVSQPSRSEAADEMSAVRFQK